MLFKYLSSQLIQIVLENSFPLLVLWVFT